MDSSVQTEWYILSLQSLITKLRPEYKADDYAKLYLELSEELEQSIEQMNYDKVAQILDSARYSNKELKQTELSLKGLEHVEFNKKVQDFIDNAKVEVYMKMVVQDKSKKLSVISRDASLNLKFQYLDNFLFEKKNDNGKLFTSIFKFLIHFPSLTKSQHEEDIFEYERKIALPKALNDYFAIVKKCLRAYTIGGDAQSEKDKNKKEIELNPQQTEHLERMYKEIKNHIMNKLYDKLYPPEADLNDIKIYQMCVLLSWVEPNHLCKVQKLNLENFLPNTVGYITKLDAVKNPNEKLKLFSKVIEIILNTLTFCIGKKCEGGVDDQLPLLVYVIIKAQPPRLASNLSFIELYYEEINSGPEAQKFAMLSAIKERLLNFHAADLNGVSGEEFSRYCSSKNC